MLICFYPKSSDYFNFVTTMLSYQVLKYIRYSFLFHICISHRGGAKISVLGGHYSARTYSSKTFDKFRKNLYKNLSQNLKHSPKFFKNKI